MEGGEKHAHVSKLGRPGPRAAGSAPDPPRRPAALDRPGASAATTARGDDAGEQAADGDSEGLAALAAWFTARGVWWPRDAVRLSRRDVVHGLGAVAARDIAAGEELFRVPRQACFGAGARGSRHVDSQREHALLLLRELDKGAASEWAPLLASLPDVRSFRELPWLWGLDAPEGDAAAVAAVAGTELELPVRSKLQRLRREHAAIGAAPQLPFALYARACGVVLSHLNPWFGTKIVPFNYILNCPADPAEPNVEFALASEGARRKRKREGRAGEDRVVVGTAIRAVARGAELLQSYGGADMATPDLAFRCGFVLEHASLRSDVVSVTAEDLLACACEATSKRALLEQAGLLQPSPWDGLDDVLTLELHCDDACAVGQLAVACAVADADPSRWATLRQAVAGAQMPALAPWEDEMDRAALSLAAAVLLQADPSLEPAKVMADLVASLLNRRARARARARTQPASGDDKGDGERGSEGGARSRGDGVRDDSDADEEEEEEELWEPLVGPDTVGALRNAERVRQVLEARLARVVAGGAAGSRPIVAHLRKVESVILQSCLTLVDKPLKRTHT
jgi:hypothetical protein